MNTEKAIKFIKEGFPDGCGNRRVIGTEFENKLIALLQRGEKFEVMWNEISTMYRIESYGTEYSNPLKIITFLEQKYLSEGGEGQWLT